MKSLSDIGLQILDKYFHETDFALTRHHIDSYEQCVFNEIPSIIHTANPIVLLKESLDKDAGIFAYRLEIFIGGDVEKSSDLRLSISPPTIIIDEGNTRRRMFPNEARLRNQTYSALIRADILIRITFTKKGLTGYESEIKESTIRDFPLLQLPILLRSRLCATSVVEPIRNEEMGECRNDYGGYFIVGGAEKILITRSEQAFNSMFVEKKPPGDDISAYASVVSLHPETKQTRRVALYLQRETAKKVACIRVAVPMIRGAFPLFILFRALGVESDEEIVRLIIPDESDPLSMQDLLIPSIVDAYPIYNKFTAFKYIMSLTKGFTEAHVLDILQNLMLPHVPDEPFARALYLADMTREILKAEIGVRGKTDRDDMRNQRFLPTGTLLRELFNGCWKDWRSAVTLTIDRTIRSNETMYRGYSLFDLFSQTNLPKIFQPELLNKGIMRGFRGKWGTNAMNEKVGVLQPLARISYLDAMSHTRRVVADFDTGMKTTGPRKLHTSQIGYFCTSETPTGAHIGVTKNMSMTTQFSIGASFKPVYDWLRRKGGLIPVAETTPRTRVSASSVQINGGTVGFTHNPVGLVKVLRLMKWTACMSPTASISFNTIERTVRILLDEGRPIRPLWHLSKSEVETFLERIPVFLQTPWKNLVFGTFPRSVQELRSTQFIDPLSENESATFGEYEEFLTPYAGAIEYCDPVEMNEALITWWGSEDDFASNKTFTHAEIHPSTLTGLMASMIPYSNHNQAPRNQLSNSQSKQGIGWTVTNFMDRRDTYTHQMCYGEAPLCRTFMYETIGNGEMPYGFNCIIAATSESGYNQDDGLILNRDSIARGMFQNIAFRSYDCVEEIDPMTKVHSHIATPLSVPSWLSLKPGMDYSRLDERGIIRVGEIVDDSTILVGRYMVIPETNEIKDDSVSPGLLTTGRVDSVIVLHQNAAPGEMSKLLVKIRIVELLTPQLGDKFSSRHGQKGTIGMLVSAADLPHTADGIVPDVMVNPGGLISRMTVAQLIEMIAGRLSVEVVAKMNATTFCNGGNYKQQVGEMLEAVGCQKGGDTVLYSGITGEQIRTDIFMCPLYFMRLKHLTGDKVNARGAGKREIRTHQPTGGRANEGGLRIGEMERDSLCAHGVSLFLQESMMKRGDETTFWVCNGCGRIPIYNESDNLYICSTCDGPLTYSGVDVLTLQVPTNQSRATFSRISMPYAMKLLDQELTTFMNTGFRYVTESSVACLREYDWDWKPNSLEDVVKPDVDKPDVDIDVDVVPQSKSKSKIQTTKKDETDNVIDTSNAVKFNIKLKNGFEGLSNFATINILVNNPQEPAPDGTQYPQVGIEANGTMILSKQNWKTVEHYFQAMKFPTNPMLQQTIRSATTPAQAQSLGNSSDNKQFIRSDWEQVKEKVMKTALIAKFSQIPNLLLLLKNTGTRPLVSESTVDAYWGVGPKRQGLNRLGKLLMDVRTELKYTGPTLKTTSGVSESKGNDEGGIAQTVQETVDSAINDVVQMISPGPSGVTGGVTGGVPGQQGGVFLIINNGPASSNRGQKHSDRGSGRHVKSGGSSESSESSDPLVQTERSNIESLTPDSNSTGATVVVEKLG